MAAVLEKTKVSKLILRKWEKLSTSSDVTIKPVGYLFIAVWFGSITGFVEALFYTIRRVVENKILFLGQDFVWMTLFANLIFFSLLGITIAIFAYFAPSYVPPHLEIFSSTFLLFATVGLLTEKISNLATLFLALGIAYQLTRFIIPRLHTFIRFTQRSFIWVISLNVILYLFFRWAM